MCATKSSTAALSAGRIPQFQHRDSNIIARQEPSRKKQSSRTKIPQCAYKKENAYAGSRSKADGKCRTSQADHALRNRCTASRSARPPRRRRQNEKATREVTVTKESKGSIRRERGPTIVPPGCRSSRPANNSRFDDHSIRIPERPTSVLGKRKQRDIHQSHPAAKHTRTSYAPEDITSHPNWSAAQKHLHEARLRLLHTINAHLRAESNVVQPTHRSHRIAHLSKLQASSPDARFLSRSNDPAATQFSPTDQPSMRRLVIRRHRSYKEIYDKTCDEIAERAVWGAMRADASLAGPIPSQNHPQIAQRSKFVQRNCTLFHQRFSGRPVVAGGASVGFVPTSVVYASCPQDSPLELASLASRQYRRLRLAHSKRSP